TFFAKVDSSERREWVERALERLPDHQRIPLVLFHFEDMPYDEIARKMGSSLSKVKTDILRGREALAKILAKSGTAHEPFKPRGGPGREVRKGARTIHPLDAAVAAESPCPRHPRGARRRGPGASLDRGLVSSQLVVLAGPGADRLPGDCHGGRGGGHPGRDL